MLKIKRIYEAADNDDGYRILVDRLWPRGVSKQSAALDLWLKEIAPSPELRTWFGHKPERFAEFTARYTVELGNNPSAQELVDTIHSKPSTTLLYAARDPKYNHAQVLLEFLNKKLASKY